MIAGFRLLLGVLDDVTLARLGAGRAAATIFLASALALPRATSTSARLRSALLAGGLSGVHRLIGLRVTLEERRGDRPEDHLPHEGRASRKIRSVQIRLPAPLGSSGLNLPSRAAARRC